MSLPNDDLVEVIPVPLVLAAYRKGLFPMCHEDGQLYWHDPDPRAVFPLESVKPNTRLQRVMRSGKFRLTHNTAFDDVIRGCADRAETWIDSRIIHTYGALYRAGHAHSVEAWHDDRLVGGIYGIAIGGAFFAESMFSRMPSAGIVAFHTLVAHLKQRGFVLFDSQYINDFTARLGAVEIGRAAYKRSLAQALRVAVRP